MALDPDKAKEYSELLGRFQFAFDEKWDADCQEKMATAVKLVPQNDRILVAARGYGTLARISLNPAAAMDLVLRLSRAIREVGWYGNDPANTFITIQEAADAELRKARAENLGQEPLGMNDPKVLQSFKRNPDGTWTCIREVRIATDMGDLTIRPGQTFNPKGGLQMSGVNWGEHLEWMWSRPGRPQ
jgi:hypothetical protein